MEKLSVNLEYCYGIKKLQHVFEFHQHCKAHIIYAPNGSMKSSFAKTFKNISEKQKPKDLINPANPTVYSVKDETGSDIPANNIFVIETEPKNYNSIKRQASLLVNVALETEYNEIISRIESDKKAFIAAIAVFSGSPRKIEGVITEIFGKKPNQFLDCLSLVSDLVSKEESQDFSAIKYEDLFSPETLKFLGSTESIEAISEYIEKYDELISNSDVFQKDTFDHDNANTVSEALNKNGFFKAKHQVHFFTGVNKFEVINNDEELQLFLSKEKQKILSDDELVKKFEKIDNQLKNANLRKLRSIINDNKHLIPLLADLEKLKQEFIASYFRKEADQFKKLLQAYNSSLVRLSEIEDEAANQNNEWEEVVKIFEARFSVPFKIEISNKADAGLGRENPTRTFRHNDAVKATDTISENELIENVLSTGERRAHYILNIIFELRARAKDANTVIIIDDIADSFDYKNKYAIVEYLKDIFEEVNFRAIILTHNFDFFRTVSSRLNLKHNGSHIIIKDENGIRLEAAKKCLNIGQDWREKIAESENDEKIKLILSAIPLVRNLIEYTANSPDNSNMKTLTHALHIKGEDGISTRSITMGEIGKIFNSVWGTNLAEDNSKSVYSEILRIAEICYLDAEEGINIEKKIILSIAIRLKAEEFMIKRINEPNFVGFSSEQTGKLARKYKKQFAADLSELESIRVIDRVNLMTPENIHFNSFMYEPILDMSDSHLKDLYKQIMTL